ncbi:hypothetical protein CTI12_AA332330 [Artemisia annua]|uniref:Uncharacterized protein n=1 Tax=Artemisia annua TaxID=35608 RepID=A0A2U1MX29_ARTAN|nr:hypothetical protein CTI12_AA332330 [Artemisia annua]
MTSYKGFLCAFEAKVEREMGSVEGKQPPAVFALFVDVSVVMLRSRSGSLTDSLCIKALMSIFKSFSTCDIRLRGSVQEVVQGVCTNGWFSGSVYEVGEAMTDIIGTGYRNCCYLGHLGGQPYQRV